MTRQDSYRMVIEAEIRSQKLYDALANSFRNSDTSKVFNELIMFEQAHEAKVREAFTREFPHEKLELTEGNTPILQGVNLTDPKDVLEYAISREELAAGIYLSMAEQTTDTDIKAMLIRFANEEENHKTLLLAEVQRLHGALNWYDPSELTGLMED
jgi:rubrerythrin